MKRKLTFFYFILFGVLFLPVGRGAINVSGINYFLFDLFLPAQRNLWDLSSPTRYWTWVLSSDNANSWPLAHWGIPALIFFFFLMNILLTVNILVSFQNLNQKGRLVLCLWSSLVIAAVITSYFYNFFFKNAITVNAQMCLFDLRSWSILYCHST